MKYIAPKQPEVTPSAAPAIPQSTAPQSESIPDDDNDEFNEEDSDESQEDVPDDATDEDESRSDETADKTEEPLTVDGIKEKVLNVTRQVIEVVSQDIPLAEIKISLEKELSVIMELLSSIDFLSSGRR